MHLLLVLSSLQPGPRHAGARGAYIHVPSGANGRETSHSARCIECNTSLLHLYEMSQSPSGGVLQFWQLFPWSEPFYTRLEKEFDVRPWFLFVHANGWLPVVSIILYAAMVLLLPPITSKRPVKVRLEGGGKGQLPCGGLT